MFDSHCAISKYFLFFKIAMLQEDARSFHCGDITVMRGFRFQTSHHHLPGVIYDHRNIQDLWRSSSPISSRSFRGLSFFCPTLIKCRVYKLKEEIDLTEKSGSSKKPNTANPAKKIKSINSYQKGMPFSWLLPVK